MSRRKSSDQAHDPVLAPQPQMQRHSKAKDDFVWLRWSRLLRKVMIYLKAIVCSLASTRMMNQLKHRSPALVAYGEALISHDQMIEEWNPEALPPTMPPVTTQSKNFGLPWNLNYPYQPRDCPHLVEHGRRFGNAHGKFLECISCGMVWRGLDYKVPIAQTLVTVYPVLVGTRDKPGGKVLKGETARPEARKGVSSSKSYGSSSSSRPTSTEAVYGAADFKPPARKATTKDIKEEKVSGAKRTQGRAPAADSILIHSDEEADDIMSIYSEL